MLQNKIFTKSFFAVMAIVMFQFHFFAQSPKSFSLTNDDLHKDDIYMTWNKSTPEQEMKDDCKALSEKGITIKYSDVKRNSNNEITAIRVSYSDRKGNKGNLEYNNQKPIGTIKFYKNGDEIGFGESTPTNDFFGGNPLMNGFANADDIMKQFKFNGNGGDSQSFSFSFPNDGEGFGKSKSHIRIQKDGKKPLVIEDGVITEGGDDYSKEEIDEIKKNNRIEGLGFDNTNPANKEFDFRSSEGLENFKKQMEQLKGDIIDDTSQSKNDFDKAKEDMLKAKEEMIKAREELEKTKKELEKSKPRAKTQKA